MQSRHVGVADPVGGPFPLGAHPVPGGVRFAVASSIAEAVEVCLIDVEPDGSRVERRVELTEQTFGVWHGVVSGVSPGSRYGFRVHGPYDPTRGLRCNPAKLLVDPYARRITGRLTDVDAALGYRDDPMGRLPSTVDSVAAVPLSVVTSPVEPLRDLRPEVPWEETVVYELHVKGFTQRHPDIPEHLRGTYLGVAHPAALDHLGRLGITAVELLPVQAASSEAGLLRRGAVNYWGYSTLGFHAPHAAYASEPGREIEEFRTMVSALHAAGIEVLLDVVYNHTCEGGLGGPTLSFRGIDAPAYYAHDERGGAVDITGCGNTMDPASPTVVRLVTDSLRYWAQDLGVDGFRFDLASALGRPRGAAFDPHGALLTAIATDPVLAQRKLIAEPWDATGEGYRVGGFGVQWSEWNGRYRDTVRDFWRGATGPAELAYRLAGSSDIYYHSGRRPWASINLITAHDGFTLRDLVSYEDKHNAANGEDNRDGTDDHRSWNCGVEGETTDPSILALRSRQARNLLATLLLSTGTPMLTAGDEMWRTQRGNNNAYCLDDETSWLAWPGSAPQATAGGGDAAPGGIHVSNSREAAHSDGDPVTPAGRSPGLDGASALRCPTEAEHRISRELLEFTRNLIAVRRECPALRQAEFFEGRTTPSGSPDLAWLRPDGGEMTERDWFDADRRTIGMWIDGADCRAHTRTGLPLDDHSWLLVLHAGSADIEFTLPPTAFGSRFTPVLSTAAPEGLPSDRTPLPSGTNLPLPAHTLILLRADIESEQPTTG
ncbi:glycogen debranching protein GlgX [Actinoalloteichus hymeniacidonis]|uniref:Glycogen debranching enzyme GlgX n=1 Tax=Actinoalloteichus hymeniacidonis TaxID=340345 RepID=A0AAC9HMT9_9PSEU|nr:glycogen debranching protein GlgX [Actinoalloteichus hymeniacidonis]AOS62140.1 glycogen debranching enzyme GlgX [Actinoalloteichus hymeniacidonis]MBB5909838.1 glycogen operon protein [Actinoalloteichus hymeniacidonis]